MENTSSLLDEMSGKKRSLKELAKGLYSESTLEWEKILDVKNHSDCAEYRFIEKEEQYMSTLDLLDRMGASVEDLQRIQVNVPERKEREYRDFYGLLAYIYQLDRDVVLEAVKDIPRSVFSDESHWEKYGGLGGRLFIKYLTVLLKAQLVSLDNVARRIEIFRERKNSSELVIQTINIKVGHKVSELEGSYICSGDEKCFIAGSTDFLDSNEDWDILVLDDILEIDCCRELACEFSAVKLSSVELINSLHLNEGILEVEGTTTIKCANPISANGVITIKGTPNSTLILENTDSMQPCIGGQTHTNLSFGRWSIARDTCKKIIVDGVRVICKSVNPNFMLGEYGTNHVPEIKCINGGSLEATEATTVRVMVREQEYVDGSTKLETYPEYTTIDSLIKSHTEQMCRVSSLVRDTLETCAYKYGWNESVGQPHLVESLQEVLGKDLPDNIEWSLDLWVDNKPIIQVDYQDSGFKYTIRLQFKANTGLGVALYCKYNSETVAYCHLVLDKLNGKFKFNADPDMLRSVFLKWELKNIFLGKVVL